MFGCVPCCHDYLAGWVTVQLKTVGCFWLLLDTLVTLGCGPYSFAEMLLLSASIASDVMFGLLLCLPNGVHTCLAHLLFGCVPCFTAAAMFGCVQQLRLAVCLVVVPEMLGCVPSLPGCVLCSTALFGCVPYICTLSELSVAVFSPASIITHFRPRRISGHNKSVMFCHTYVMHCPTWS